jgi:hypothetical protein
MLDDTSLVVTSLVETGEYAKVGVAVADGSGGDVDGFVLGLLLMPPLIASATAAADDDAIPASVATAAAEGGITVASR